MKPIRLLLCLVTLLACSVARATITIEIDADYLTNSGNVAVADNSALFLVADETGAGFSLPTTGTYSVGSAWGGSTNDFVVGAFAVDSSTTGVTGAIDLSEVLTLSSVSGWASGQPLELVWFSNENYNSLGTTISNGAAYGDFGFDSVGSDSSTWVTLTNGNTGPAYVFHSAFAQNSPPATPIADVPSYGIVTAAVPEPSTFALLAGLVGLSAAAYRRRKSATMANA